MSPPSSTSDTPILRNPPDPATNSTAPKQIQVPADDLTVMQAFTSLAKVNPDNESKQVLGQIQRLATRLSQSLSEAVSMHEISSVDRKVARLRFAEGLEASLDQADAKLRQARRHLAQYRIEEDKARSLPLSSPSHGGGGSGSGGLLDLTREDSVEKALGDALLNTGAARNAISPDHPACIYDAGFCFIRDD